MRKRPPSQCYTTPCECFECGRDWLIATGDPALPEMHYEHVDEWKHCPYCGGSMIGYLMEDA